MPARKIKPEFTKAQAGEVRVALKDLLEFRADNGMERRAALNALEELDRAELASRRLSVIESAPGEQT